MLNLIVGNKGSGKTKRLIEMIDNSLKVSKGDIVCIEKGLNMTYDINHKVRLVSMNDYEVSCVEGMYGFVSSPAANSFAIAWLASSIIKTKQAWNLLLLWAVLVSYSRIYLGVHYPGDIIGGALVGIFSGYIAVKVYFLIEEKWVN